MEVINKSQKIVMHKKAKQNKRTKQDGNIKITQEQRQDMGSEPTQKIKLMSTNPEFYKTFTHKSITISVYVNAKQEERYYLLFTTNKTRYYIKFGLLDNIDNIEQFKNVVVENVCFYKSVVLENYYNLYKNLKVDIYKDVPEEALHNYDNIKVTFNGYYYIKNSMFSNYPNLFCVLPILKMLK